MPDRIGSIRRMELLSVADRGAIDAEFQSYWYHLAGKQYTQGKSALDVGAGTGYGMRILREEGAVAVAGIDPLPMTPEIGAADVSAYPVGAYDWCVCCDVIEHVQDDFALLQHMIRVAREGVFFSTPNWNWFHCQNDFHLREYTWRELRDLVMTVAPHAIAELWAGPESPASEPVVSAPSWPALATATNFGVALRWTRG
jgi:2-polyprenyl-3-methyl-5-hydroxy-6-metoxy-1,4-benzoquinol methylase